MLNRALTLAMGAVAVSSLTVSAGCPEPLSPFLHLTKARSIQLAQATTLPNPPAFPAQAAAVALTNQRSTALGPVSNVRSWGYNLQKLDIDALAASPYDVLVIDYSKDGSDEAALTKTEVERLRKKPDGTPRVVLSYVSIGEAETYRYYWKWTWGGRWYSDWLGWFLAPRWLSSHNSEWGGNYAVRYWDPRWQMIILDKGGYLERIIAAGFDGVWLDKVDSSIEKVARNRPTAQDDMRAFVRRIAERGRGIRPGFLVVPQNGEELLTDPAYRSVISGIGKEDLLFGEFKHQQANPPDVVERRMELLKLLTSDGKTVLAVEYLDHAGHIAEARKSLSQAGFVPHFADRSLDHLRIGDGPASLRSGRQ